MRQFVLPWPPSVNHYWRMWKNRMLISREGREYRKRIGWCINKVVPERGRLAVNIDVYPPDARRRDIDNLAKAVLDALQHQKVYMDDNQIDRLVIQRMGKVKDGSIVVRIQEILSAKVE